jgi:sirohydrochlorin cobaltochelatase
MRTALVLAGHGSHISPNTAGIVWEQVDRLRAMGVADEITAAFWKEMPSFHTVFNTLTADDITVVPLFTAQGYFTQTVIPAEMGLTGVTTERDGRTIRYTRTLGEHPYLFKVVEDWVNATQQELHVPPEETAVAIVGHSTRRNPDSRKAAEAQAAHLRRQNIFAQVAAVYLDDSPAIADIYTLTTAPNLIIIPFFLAEGSHTTIDVPRELGLADGKSRGTINGRNVFYTPPVGLTDRLTEVILELAQEAGAPLKPPGEGSSWDCFPSKGVKILSVLVERFGGFHVGQLRLTPTEVRHNYDKNPIETITEPGELRRLVRERNGFRPLATSKDLPLGWRIPITRGINQVYAVVETIYPGAASQLPGFSPDMKFNTLVEVVARQTGQYRKLADFSRDQERKIVERMCGNCIQTPRWFSFHGQERKNLHCPEPCNYWLSAALEGTE